MTGMLASVTSVAEAKIVLAVGVDIIDIKNPHEGALGAQDLSVVKEIVKLASQEALTSATIGDIASNDPELLNKIIKMSETGVDYVKVGLFEPKPSSYFIRTIINAVNKGIKLVIVVFAENYKGIASIESLLRSGIIGIMLDTKEKKSKNLCALLNNDKLKEFVEIAKSYGLLTGLAGSLRYDDIESLLLLNSDYLGFRGALCSESDRVKSINKVQVEKIRASIPFIEFNNTEYKEVIN